MFRIKKKYLTLLAIFLEQQELSGKDNIARVKFLKIIKESLKEVFNKQNELMNKYIKKDLKGNFKIKKGNDGIDYFVFKNDKARENYWKEMNKVYEQELTIRDIDKNKSMLDNIKRIIENTDYKFGPNENDDAQTKQMKIRMSYEYPEWIKAFEN